MNQGVSSAFPNIQAAITADFPHVNSILVIRHNTVVVEKYFHGFSEDTPQPTGCIFKTLISAAVGAAVTDGLIGDLEWTVTDIFTDCIPNTMDDRMGEITLRHALTKTTGLVWPPPGEAMAEGMEAVFALALQDDPGAVFAYKPDPQILVYTLSRLSGMDFGAYIHTRLFAPLGIGRYQWDTSYGEIENLKMAVPDIGKIGCLYLNRGLWEGKRIISEDYIRASTTPQTRGGFPEQTDYGYLWWIDAVDGIPVYYASGFGGQMLCVIPRCHAVVVITSEMDRPHRENKLLVRDLIRSMLRHE